MLGAYGILHGTGWASGMLGAGNVWFRLLIFLQNWAESWYVGREIS